MAEKRIISLLPAATEIVCALGLENQLVGRSHECDYPESVRALPVCTSTHINSDSSSCEIDNQVKATLTEALSVYQIEKDLVRHLQPDTVITQTQCEVCAISLKDVEAALDDLLEREADIISLNPNNLDDVFNDIRRVAEKLDAAHKGEALLEELFERKELIRHKLKFIEHRPRIACMEWLSPLMLAGNWTPELVQIAGGNPLLAESGKHSPYITAKDLTEANPDIIIVAVCGFTIERTLQEINLLLDVPGLREINAVKNDQVYIADGNSYFNRSGPRIIDTIEILAEIIHPKQFIFGYEGNGWLKFSLS